MILIAWRGVRTRKQEDGTTHDVLARDRVASQHDLAMHALAEGGDELVLVYEGGVVYIVGPADGVCFYDVVSHCGWGRS
jgi:hypothetical protein